MWPNFSDSEYFLIFQFIGINTEYAFAILQTYSLRSRMQMGNVVLKSLSLRSVQEDFAIYVYS